MSKQKIAIGAILVILILMGWILWPFGEEAVDISLPDTRQADATPLPTVTEINENIQEESEKIVLPSEQRIVPFTDFPKKDHQFAKKVDHRIFYGRVVENNPVLQPLMGIKIVESPNRQSSIVTDSTGLFSMRVGLLSFGSSHISIHAKGYGPVLVKLTKGHDNPDKALLIKLDRAATVYGQVHGPAEPWASASVILSTSSFEISQGDDSLYLLEDPTWQAQTDGSGSYRLEGLPPNAGLTVKVSLKGKDPVLMQEKLFLKPGEERYIDWYLSSLATIRGRVVDQYHRPVSDVRVAVERWNLEEGIRDNRPVLISGLLGKPEETMTDQNGAFVFANLTPGRTLVYVMPESNGEVITRGNLQTEDVADDSLAVSPIGLIVHIPKDLVNKEIVLKVHRGLFIQGRVLDPEGKPVHARILASVKNCFGMMDILSEKDGRFKIGPLLPGRYSLQACNVSFFQGSNVVEANAGDSDVVLQLSSGGTLSGRIINQSGIDLQKVEITAYRRETKMFQGEARFHPNGSFRFEDLETGTYDLIAHLGDRWVGVATGVQVVAGSETKEVLITLEAAATLVVNLINSKSPFGCFIEYQGATLETGGVSLDRPSTFNIPSGHLRVCLVQIEAGEKAPIFVEVAAKEINIKAGEEVEITFDLKK